MNHVPDTELFSAYLDGELTADEQVRVEQVLATSAEARQLLEELRALDSTLQCLPQVKLDEDLSARVLEIAERRMLLPNDTSNEPSAGRAAEALQGPEADSIGWLGVPWREISWRGMLSRRALIWSGVVVATAIIIGYTSPPPPKLNQNQNIARLDKQPALGAPAVSGEVRRGSSTSDGSWDVPASQRRKLRTDDMLAKDDRRRAADAKDRPARTDAESALHDDKDRDKIGELKGQLAMRDGSEFRSRSGGEMSAMKKAVGERAADKAGKEAFANDETGRNSGGRSKEKAVRLEEKKAAAPMDAVADNKPAAMPMPAKPAAPAPSALAPSPMEQPLADAAKNASEPPLPPVAMSNAVAPSRAPATSNANAFGAHRVASAKRGTSKADDSPELDMVNEGVARSSDAPRQQLMNGTGAEVTNNSSAEVMAGGNKKGGQAPAIRFASPNAPAAIHVRLDVSALAVQNKVFEHLLANNGLGSDPISTNNNLRALKSEGNIQARTARANEQGGIVAKALPEQRNDQRDSASGLQQQVRENLSQKPDGTVRKQEARSVLTTSSQPMIYEFDASPEQLAVIIKQIGERSDSFSPPKFAENYGYLANNSSDNYSNSGNNYSGGGGGGRLADRPVERQQAQADVGGANLRRGEAAQPQAATAAAPGSANQTASLAAGAEKQHVVFVLTVVDRLTPAANRASQVPAATSTPAKQ